MPTLTAIRNVLEVVRHQDAPEKSLTSLVTKCSRAAPSPLWEALPSVDVQQDITAATTWLAGEIASCTLEERPTGIFLGLDTLNMQDSEEGGPGFNVEIGLSTTCKPSSLDNAWCWECQWHGGQHLIAGLAKLSRKYSAKKWSKVYSDADYLLPLGYSGIVLASAIESLKGIGPALVIWGFHDGDLFPLVRCSKRSTTRICT